MWPMGRSAIARLLPLWGRERCLDADAQAFHLAALHHLVVAVATPKFLLIWRQRHIADVMRSAPVFDPINCPVRRRKSLDAVGAVHRPDGGPQHVVREFHGLSSRSGGTGAAWPTNVIRYLRYFERCSSAQ